VAPRRKQVRNIQVRPFEALLTRIYRQLVDYIHQSQPKAFSIRILLGPEASWLVLSLLQGWRTCQSKQLAGARGAQCLRAAEGCLPRHESLVQWLQIAHPERAAAPLRFINHLQGNGRSCRLGSRTILPFVRLGSLSGQGDHGAAFKGVKAFAVFTLLEIPRLQ